MGNDYLVQEMKEIKPKIKIIGIGEKMTIEEIMESIINQNPIINKNEAIINVKITKKMKTKYMAIVEVDSTTFKNIMEIGKIKIGWCICNVYEHIDILRCFKCFGYNHKATHCTNNASCFNCGGNDHKGENCTNQFKKCVNCISINKNLGLNFDYGHTAYDINCPVFRRYCEKRKENVSYKA